MDALDKSFFADVRTNAIAQFEQEPQELWMIMLSSIKPTVERNYRVQDEITIIRW